jgi:hypothetical protein
VYEQGDRDTTFGFGVGLAAGTQRKLEAADPDTLRDIQAAGRRHDMTMDVAGAVVRVHNDNLIGIARTDLLDVLQRHADDRAGDVHRHVVAATGRLDVAQRVRVGGLELALGPGREADPEPEGRVPVALLVHDDLTPRLGQLQQAGGVEARGPATEHGDPVQLHAIPPRIVRRP